MKRYIFITFILLIFVVGYYIYLNGQRNLILIADGKVIIPEKIVFIPDTTVFSLSKNGQINFSFYDSKQKYFKCISNKGEFAGEITPANNCIIKYENGEAVSSEYNGVILPFYSTKYQFNSNKRQTK